MAAIARNLTLLVIWVALSGALAVGISRAAESSKIGGGTAVVLWLLGQCVVLSPLLWMLWRDRGVGAEE